MKHFLKPSILAFLILSASCSLDDRSEDVLGSRSDGLVCTPASADHCCLDTNDNCGAAYGLSVNEYLEFLAYSNGSCTNNVSGEYQCAAFAKNFYSEQLYHIKCSDGTESCRGFSQAWTPWNKEAQAYVNVALDAEATNDNEADRLFVFQSHNSGWESTKELPRETDILVFENGGAGHFVVVKVPDKESNNEYNLPIIEQNVAMLSGNGPGGSCHHRVLVATKQSDGRWEIPSGIGNSYTYAGFIRHNLAGIYGDNGWHDDGTSRSFRDAYVYANAHSDNEIGWAFDNGGGPFVHRVHRVSMQDFIYTDTDHQYGTDGQSAIILAPNGREAFLVKEGFWGAYKCLPGPQSNEDTTLVSGNIGGAYWLGAPTNNEHPSNGTVFQDFECGFMYVEGSKIKVHLEPGRSNHCPEPQLDTYELVARSREACPDLEVESNWPVGALCDESREVCDGKDNNSDGFADENCGDASDGVLRVRYSLLGCAERMDVVGNVYAEDGTSIRSAWNPPFCRLEHSNAILCDIPVDQNGRYITGNVVSHLSGRTYSVCEQFEQSDSHYWFGDLTAEWNGTELTPQIVYDDVADVCRFHIDVPEQVNDEPTQEAVCPNGSCENGETCGSCQDDCCPEPPLILSPQEGTSWTEGSAINVSWETSESAKRYMLAFCEDPNYANCPFLVDGINVGITQYAISELWNGTWYVSARAIPWDESGWGYYSNMVRFNVISSNPVTISTSSDGVGGSSSSDPSPTQPVDQGTGGTPPSDPVTTPPANQGSGGSVPVDPVTCTDECTAGTIGCLNAQTVTTCVGPTVDIPCYHWLTTGSCATGETCIQDQGCFLCDVDGDGSLNATCGGDDCDDLDAARRPGQQESCDGMDNDCDFAVDEDIPSSGTCTSGIGACLRTGSIVCTGGAMHCDAVAGQPSAEICGNGVDEDCNGTPDNGCTPVCDPSDIACSTCYEPIRSSTNILCVDDEGRLFYRMDAFSYNGSLIPQSQIAAGLWHAYVWLDDEPWWIEMDLVPVAGISGALYAVLPQTLPSGLCPFGITPSRHPIRVSNPYRGTFVSGGTSFALDGTLRVCGDAQTGLTANFTYLNDCGIAVQRDGSGRWSPAAAQAEADMTGARIHCTP